MHTLADVITVYEQENTLMNGEEVRDEVSILGEVLDAPLDKVLEMATTAGRAACSKPNCCLYINRQETTEDHGSVADDRDLTNEVAITIVSASCSIGDLDCEEISGKAMRNLEDVFEKALGLYDEAAESAKPVVETAEQDANEILARAKIDYEITLREGQSSADDVKAGIYSDLRDGVWNGTTLDITEARSNTREFANPND